MNERKITIYTDGACLGNPGKGGWGAALRYGKREKQISGGYALTTNNRMELTAVIEALKIVKGKSEYDIHIYTDSNLIFKAMEEGWLKNWKRTNWRKKDKSPVLNVDLWKQIDELCQDLRVTFHWVKGHAGNPDNELCDKLSKLAAELPELPDDEVYLQEQNIK